MKLFNKRADMALAILQYAYNKSRVVTVAEIMKRVKCSKRECSESLSMLLDLKYIETAEGVRGGFNITYKAYNTDLLTFTKAMFCSIEPTGFSMYKQGDIVIKAAQRLMLGDLLEERT